MKTKLITTSQKIFNSLGELFSFPEVSALCQSHPITATIAAYLGGKYQQDQFENMVNFIHLLHARLKNVEERKVDKKFLE